VSTGPVTGSAGDDAETRGAVPDAPEPDPDSWDVGDVAAAGGASAFPGAEVVAALPEAPGQLAAAAALADKAAALAARRRSAGDAADPAAAAAAAGLPPRPWELVPNETGGQRASIEAGRGGGGGGGGAPAPGPPRRAGPPGPKP
jgi:hypothetical protein